MFTIKQLKALEKDAKVSLDKADEMHTLITQLIKIKELPVTKFDGGRLYFTYKNGHGGSSDTGTIYPNNSLAVALHDAVVKHLENRLMELTRTCAKEN